MSATASNPYPITADAAESHLAELTKLAHGKYFAEALRLQDALQRHLDARGEEGLRLRGLIAYVLRRCQAEIGNAAAPINPVFGEFIDLIRDAGLNLPDQVALPPESTGPLHAEGGAV